MTTLLEELAEYESRPRTFPALGEPWEPTWTYGEVVNRERVDREPREPGDLSGYVKALPVIEEEERQKRVEAARRAEELAMRPKQRDLFG